MEQMLTTFEKIFSRLLAGETQARAILSFFTDKV
jgi:hypothetical protein